MSLKLWQRLTEISEIGDNDVPLLLHDPVALLILFVLNANYRLHELTYKYIVSFVFNLAYVQNIIVLIAKISTSELQNWYPFAIEVFIEFEFTKFQIMILLSLKSNPETFDDYMKCALKTLSEASLLHVFKNEQNGFAGVRN